MQRFVGHEVKRLSNLFRQAIGGCDNCGTYMQGLFLAHLHRHSSEDCFQKDLEAEFRIRRSTATGILQVMERDGLLRRESVPYDARLKRLVLTEAGEALFRQMEENLARVESRAVSGLTPSELSSFFSTLDKIKHNLENSKEDSVHD